MLSRILAFGLLLCAVLLCAPPVSAKNIYKYQDENGIWHFTDKAPQENIQFETVYMEREREDRIQPVSYTHLTLPTTSP